MIVVNVKFIFSGCTVNQIFETKTVGVGANVTLTCPRKSSGSIFWIRLVSGDIPKVLAKTYSLESDPRITATEEPGEFVLHIEKGRRSDTAVYLCVKIHQQNLTFLKGADVRVEGPEPDITAVTQDPSDPVRPGDSVTLQCSVLSDSEKKSCPGNHSVFWFRAASDEFHPSAIYAHGNRAECEKSPEAHSPQKCIYSFSKDVSFSDAGTYYCAVATCGEILFGDGTKLDVEDVSRCDSQNDNTVLFLVCAALAVSLIVIAILVHAIRTKSSNCSNDALVPVTTVQLGEPVTLTCDWPNDEFRDKLHWYKQSAGETLKLIVRLRKEFSAVRLDVKVYKSISSLSIWRTIQEDDCAVMEWTEITWSGTYLSLKGDHSVFWFRAGSDQSHPDIIYTDGNRRDECDRNSDTQKSCVYRFSKNVGSSDAGTYYCAVATCGQILFGDGTKVEIEGILIFVMNEDALTPYEKTI
ncbi:hypothetical protein ABVT39_025298 [Epinephelus coioides]